VLGLAAACAGARPGVNELDGSSRRPLVVTHRSMRGAGFPENTLEAMANAIQGGSGGLEVDVSFTRDGRLVLWHDEDPRAPGETWPLAYDVGGPAPWHCPRSALPSARALGVAAVSLARPVLGLGAWEAFVASIRADRADLEAEVQAGGPRRRLLVWTLDREDELRAAIGLGVDVIITDEPALLEQLLGRPGPVDRDQLPAPAPG